MSRFDPYLFNNDADETTDAEYFAYVEWLSVHTAAEMREAKGDANAEKNALCRYYKRGLKANLTPSELIDFLGVSTPSILDAAGYSDDEALALFAVSDALTDAEIEQAVLPEAVP